MGEGEGEREGEKEGERDGERGRGKELEERGISFFTAIKFCQTTNHL